jgi:hypothetical protein
LKFIFRHGSYLQCLSFLLQNLMLYLKCSFVIFFYVKML